jgi:fused-like protein
MRACVCQGRRKFSGQIVAMKFIVKHGKSDKDLESLRQEIAILRTLNHENIILLLDWFETKSQICVVTEFAQGELFEILEDDTKLPEDQVRSIAVQLIHALHYLHSPRHEGPFAVILIAALSKYAHMPKQDYFFL